MTADDLVEIERIKQLKARYFLLMDQKRWDEWADVFCEDVTIDTREEGTPLIHGRDDAITPLDGARRLRAMLEQSRLVVVDDAAHQVMEERGERVNELISAFLASTEGPAERGR